MGPHRRQPTRLPRPWDSPGKNTGVGCHFLLQCIKVKSESEVAQSCPTLCDPMDCSPPGSSVLGIFQARVLEGGAIAFSKEYWGGLLFPSPGDLPDPETEPASPALAGGFFMLSLRGSSLRQAYWVLILFLYPRMVLSYNCYLSFLYLIILIHVKDQDKWTWHPQGW